MSYGSMLRQEFTDYLDSQGFKYMIADESDNIVVLGFAASRSKLDTTIFVDFDENTDMHGVGCVHFVAQGFAHCADDKLGEVFVKLNELNRRYRWVKFWINEENKAITADADALLFEGSTGLECLDYVIHVSDIVENAFNALEGLIVENMGGDDDSGDPSADEILQMLEMLRRMMGDSE